MLQRAASDESGWLVTDLIVFICFTKVCWRITVAPSLLGSPSKSLLLVP